MVAIIVAGIMAVAGVLVGLEAVGLYMVFTGAGGLWNIGGFVLVALAMLPVFVVRWGYEAAARPFYYYGHYGLERSSSRIVLRALQVVAWGTVLAGVGIAIRVGWILQGSTPVSRTSAALTVLVFGLSSLSFLRECVTNDPPRPPRELDPQKMFLFRGPRRGNERLVEEQVDRWEGTKRMFGEMLLSRDPKDRAFAQEMMDRICRNQERIRRRARHSW